MSRTLCSVQFFELTNLFRPSALDVQFVDYDGVRFHLSTPQSKTTLLLSMHISKGCGICVITVPSDHPDFVKTQTITYSYVSF